MAAAVLCVAAAETVAPCPSGTAPSGDTLYYVEQAQVVDVAAAVDVHNIAFNTILGSFLFAFIVSKIISMVR